MLIKEEEKAKVNSSDIRQIEKILSEIEIEELRLIEEFDLNAENIFGSELLAKLSKVTYRDELTGNFVPLFRDVTSKTIKSFHGKIEVPYCGILQSVHKSHISDPVLRAEYEEKLKRWFSSKTEELKVVLDHRNTSKEVNRYLPVAYALASLALTSFHKNSNMRLRDVQLLTGIAISNGDVAELGTGEGKTLAGVLPTYLHALRGKGVHVVTANSYLAKRDFEEIRPIFDGLGLSSGFNPEVVEDIASKEGFSSENLTTEQRKKLEKRLKIMKQEAYLCDVTYGSKSSFAFDYLRDSTISKREDMLQREENPGFALIDEIDDILIDDAQCPYVLGGNLPIYTRNMTFTDLANVLNKPFEEVSSKVEKMGMSLKRFDRLDYDTARNIAVTLYDQELVPEQVLYQRRAQRFFESYVKKDIYVIREGAFGLSAEELYDVLTDEEKTVSYRNKEIERVAKEEIARIKKESSVIFNPDKRKYEITDKCYNDFLTYCYAAFQANSVANANRRAIFNDRNYVNGRDYNVVDEKIVFTFDGIKRIINDQSHPEFYNDYDRYMSMIHPESVGIIHYFDQAVLANLVMRKPEDYVVHNGRVKVVKNSRIQEGSTYTDGLQQAIELKEGIEDSKQTKENHIIASVTQKDFYNRYDMFSGMTGTSSKKVFSEIFGKNTVSIPRHAFYSYYSSRSRRHNGKANEPVGVEKLDTVFAIGQNEKILLMVNSIKESLNKNPAQPVLLVVSNPEEMRKISLALQREGIFHSILDATTDKSKEAQIIAKAGLPGAVTISTEMAGRGTDIKLGGDRETIIDIATENHLKKIEKKLGTSYECSSSERQKIREIVETALLNASVNGNKFLWSKKEEFTRRKELENVGLKVISSGYFNIDRIDRQLEGRTGRNGVTGVCERFACPEDFEFLGISDITYGKSIREYFRTLGASATGVVNVRKKDYDKLTEKVRIVQSNNESNISASIKHTQELSRASSMIIEKYREERRKIVCGSIDIDIEIQRLFEATIDNLLMSYIVGGQVNSSDLLSSLANNDFKIDLPTFALETKAVLGINVDPDAIIAGDLNLLELRNALLNTVIENHRKKREDDPIGQLERDRHALIVANDYAISNVSSILSLSGTQKTLTSMSMGMENMADYSATMEFTRGVRQMRLEASKYAVKGLMGVVLSKEESKELEERKNEIFGYRISRSSDSSGYLLDDPLSIENDGEDVLNFRKISEPVEERAEREIEKANKKAQKLIDKGKKEAAESLYTNLSIRPLKFISSLSDSFDRLVLVQGQPMLKDSVSLGGK